MIDIDKAIQEQMGSPLWRTDFDFLGTRYEGKVRDNYTRGDTRYIIATDRISCFDRVLTAIPFKGQVLNELALYWFEKTAHVVPNHIISAPDPNVFVTKNCEVLPVEVVVRAYLAGSSWRDYSAGRSVSGLQLAPGLKMHQKLSEPILTPSTKAEIGMHDEPISEAEILARGLVEPELWKKISEASRKLFEIGSEDAASKGLLLVDTKYEFGLYNGELLLVDEIHTLDSSRYWVAETYEEAFRSGQAPEMLDKEPVRRWLMEKGFMGDGPIPDFSPDYIASLSRHYVDSCSRISGKPFIPFSGDIEMRIKSNLLEYTDLGIV